MSLARVAYLPGTEPEVDERPTHRGPGHPTAIFPGGVRVCVAHQRAEPCLCGSWLVADEGFECEAVAEHQRSTQHRAWRAERIERERL